MFARFIIFLTGFGLTTIGFVYIILFFNYLSIGYNFWDYVNFIIRQFECYYVIIGIILMLAVIYGPGGNNDELRL